MIRAPTTHATPEIMTAVAGGVGDTTITVVVVADGTGIMTVVGLGIMTGETGREIGIDMGVGKAGNMRGGIMGGGIKKQLEVVV